MRLSKAPNKQVQEVLKAEQIVTTSFDFQQRLSLILMLFWIYIIDLSLLDDWFSCAWLFPVDMSQFTGTYIKILASVLDSNFPILSNVKKFGNWTKWATP